MTIRRRLTLSYLAILTLLGLNMVIYFWSDLRRKSTFEELRRAVSRQILISSIHQQLNDYQKQVTLLSQIMADSVSGGASPEEITLFNTRLTAIGVAAMLTPGLFVWAKFVTVPTEAKYFKAVGKHVQLIRTGGQAGDAEVAVAVADLIKAAVAYCDLNARAGQYITVGIFHRA